jgi:hypothetical protein
MPLGTEPELLNFSGPQAPIPQNRFLAGINSVMELILGRGEGEGVHPVKLIPALKINIYWTWQTRFHT